MHALSMHVRCIVEPLEWFEPASIVLRLLANALGRGSILIL